MNPYVVIVVSPQTKSILNKRSGLTALMILIWVYSFSQLSVNQQNAQNLVQNVLVGTGVTVSGITFTGNPAMIGSFNGASSNIGLQSGVIMSTGVIQDAVGPNNSASKGEDLNQGGYGPLANLLGGNVVTKDAAILRFSFICENDKVQFKYVFASEEYPEYVGSEFNDVFAFFIQGPGISGMQNIAVIPGTSQPVAINNVNQGSYSSYFVNNGSGGNGGGSSVQFDGFTTPFYATAAVTPCKQYTITIAITDVKDGIYDSAVFLEAQSFTSPEIAISSKISYLNGSDKLYEGCGFNTVTLTRTGPVSGSQTIFLESGGTATYGLDYTGFPKVITFQPGESQKQFQIDAFMDGLNEPGGESVAIVYRDTGCNSVIEKRVDFIIYDPPPAIVISPGNALQLLCPREPVLLNANVDGGVGPHTIQWLQQRMGNPLTVYPDSSTYYVVEITDQCGSKARDSLFAEIKDYVPLKLIVKTDTIICRGDAAVIGGFSSGGKLPVTYFWDTPGVNTPTQLVRPQTTTEYNFSVTDSCGITIAKRIRVQVIEAKAIYDISYIDHSTIQFTDLSYTNIISWEWDFGDGTGTSSEQNPVYTFQDTGLFNTRLIVSNEQQCKDTVSNPIRSFPPFNLWIPNAFTPDGDGLNDYFSGVGEGFISYEMYIFNRWGEQIFHTDSYTTKWGREGREVLDSIPVDVYTYKIIVGTPQLERKEYIGRVSVIR